MKYSGLPRIAEYVLLALDNHGPLTAKQISDAIREFNSGYRTSMNAINRALRESLKGKVVRVGKAWSKADDPPG